MANDKKYGIVFTSSFMNTQTDFLIQNDSGIQEPRESWARSLADFFLELIKVVAICAAIIILVRLMLFQPFYVKGSSMEPNYHDGEYLIIYQLPYRFPHFFHTFTEKERGRTIIFHPPNDPKEFYIKRLIALPGERVKIEDGVITIYNQDHPEGFALQEQYLPDGVRTMPGTAHEVTIGLDKIFVLGDNRSASLDSRRIGSVPVQNVIGEPIVRGWPLNRIGILRKPIY